MLFGKKEEKTSNTLKKKTPKKPVVSFSFKSSEKKATGNTKRVDDSSTSKFELAKVKAFFEDQKNRYIIGIVCLFLAAYLTSSFTSYFFTWKADQDKLETWSAIGSEAFQDNTTGAANNTGTLGARVAHFFIHQFFGISSYVIPFIFLAIGLKLTFKKEFFPLKKSIKISLFYGLLASSFFSLIFQNSSFNPGGGFGFQLNNWIDLLIGKAGLISVLILSLVLSMFAFFNIRLDELFSKLFPNAIQNNSETIKTELVNETTINSNSNDNIDLLSETNSKTSHTVYPPSELEHTEASEELDAAEQVETPVTAEESVNTIEFETPIIETKPAAKAPSEDLELEVEETKKEEPVSKVLPDSKENYDPTLDLSSYKFPTIELLKDYEVNNQSTVDTELLEKNKNNIVETLKNYKINIKSIKASIGPTVTLYEIVPADGVRISKIKNLEDDIALSLAALGIRIIAPIPGKGTIGIEVPNPNPEVVSMRTVIGSKAFNDTTMDLPIALGKTISNETFVVDLAKMPHLLMAGATGQGKSVGLNCILVSLLYKKHPSQLKFVLVDPKKVELTLFNKIVRHFLAKLPGDGDAIITETSKVVNTLNSLCVEMDQRYELLKEAHCRNLKEYNKKFVERKLNPEKGHRFMPFIVLVVDEFADLIMTAGKEVETPIARLAQLARAIGIHLIIATQRPSVNIITGTIKANFPARIAFRVTSKIDSRTILDAGGADQLIGRGDMLLSTGNDIIRLQCAFVDTPEVEEITEFIGEQRGYPDAFMLPEYNDGNDSEGGVDINLEDRDVLFEEAAKVIVMHQQGSASLLQRKLKLGYNRAGRIVDQLEAAGIIGPFEGSKARQVLIPDEHSLEQYLNYGDETKTE